MAAAVAPAEGAESPSHVLRAPQVATSFRRTARWARVRWDLADRPVRRLALVARVVGADCEAGHEALEVAPIDSRVTGGA